MKVPSKELDEKIEAIRAARLHKLEHEVEKTYAEGKREGREEMRRAVLLAIRVSPGPYNYRMQQLVAMIGAEGFGEDKP